MVLKRLFYNNISRAFWKVAEGKVHINTGVLIEIVIGIGLIIQNIYGLKHIKSQAKMLRKLFVGIFSESVCYKIYLFLGPFNILVGLVFFIDGLSSLFS